MPRTFKNQKVSSVITVCFLVFVLLDNFTFVTFILVDTPREHYNSSKALGSENHIYGGNDEKEEVEVWNLPFFDNITNNIARGANFITPVSGCAFSTWALAENAFKLARDCEMVESYRQLEKHAHEIQANDTIYVPTKALPAFVNKFLPIITEPFVLISGQYKYTIQKRLPRGIANIILKHPMILHWFCQNPDVYRGLDLPNLHPKLSSFPFGIQHAPYSPGQEDPLVAFRQAFFRHIQLPKNKTGLLHGYLNKGTSPLIRNFVPSGPWLPRRMFYDRLAESNFILSPRGDRPDCYRNYEALAFGVIPITDLDPEWYSHFGNSSVIFSTTNWSLTENDAKKQVDVAAVDRNMIFEEYWLEYVERTVGRRLRWWDRQQKKPSLLADFLVDYELVHENKQT